eukprot:1160156-Pelagomonas_calceolata.AAC.5
MGVQDFRPAADSREMACSCRIETLLDRSAPTPPCFLAGFPDSGESREERAASLEVCIQNAANVAHLPATFMVFCMYDLAKRLDMDTKRGYQYSSSKCADTVHAARNLIRQLLGNVPSSVAPASTSQPPVLQLGSKHLSLLAWSLSVMSVFNESISAEARQLCYALAERTSQPGVIRTIVPGVQDVHPEACRNWAGVLYGLAKVGVKCSDDARVKQVFHVCMEQELPDLLSQGQRCLPQSVSNAAMACVDAGYEGSMEPFISAVARRVGEPSMGGVGGGMMANAAPQAWSNLIYACAKLEQRGEQAGGGLGGGMSIIAEAGAAAMASALQKPVQYQPKPQELANTLWGLSYLGWYDADIIEVLAHAVVERMGSSTPQGISNTLFALSTLGWYDSGVYDALLVALLNRSDQLAPQQCSNAMYSCAVASHGGSAVDKLAQVISGQDVSKQGRWNTQDLNSALYAWAVLGCIGVASDSLNEMAQHLLREVNNRGPAASQASHLRQLYPAHLEAERVGLQGGGLSTANGMLQATAEQHIQGQAELCMKVRQSGGTAGMRHAAAALQRAGYEVELGGRVGQDGYQAELLVRHEGCPNGIAVDVLSGTDRFRHPPGQISGKARQRHAQIRQRCDGLVVLSEAAAKQPGLVVQQLDQELWYCSSADLIKIG